MGVYKRGKRWWLDYSYNGERIREPVTIKDVAPGSINKQMALTVFSKRIAEIGDGKFDIAKTKKPIPFEKLVSVFIEDYSKVNKRSWSRDITSSKALLRYFRGKKLSEITPWQANKYKSGRLKEISRLNKPISKATVNRELACLKKMLSFAVGEKWIPYNPLVGYKLEKEKLKKYRVISAEEFRKVFESASGFLKPVLITAYNTGMRSSEIRNLKWEDINLSAGLASVTESKNNEPRQIPLNDELAEVLRELRRNSPGVYVFSHTGGRVTSFKTAFNAAVRRAGVTRFTFHDLRHTYASNLVMAGVDITTVQELLGHKNISMTKRYSHPTLDHKKRAVDKIRSGVLEEPCHKNVTNVVKLKDAGDVSS